MNQIIGIYLLVSLVTVSIAIFIFWRQLERAHKQLRESEQRLMRMSSRHFKHSTKLNNVKKVINYNWRLFKT